MTEAIDLKQSTVFLKNTEQMIAFASFTIKTEENRADKEGVLKISAYYRKDNSGYLTLTFIVDTDGDVSVKDDFSQLFNKIEEKDITPYLSQKMEQLALVPLDVILESPEWFVEELNLYFRNLKGQEETLVKQNLIPALENLLPCIFQPVEWLSVK